MMYQHLIEPIFWAPCQFAVPLAQLPVACPSIMCMGHENERVPQVPLRNPDIRLRIDGAQGIFGVEGDNASDAGIDLIFRFEEMNEAVECIANAEEEDRGGV